MRKHELKVYEWLQAFLVEETKRDVNNKVSSIEHIVESKYQRGAKRSE